MHPSASGELQGGLPDAAFRKEVRTADQEFKVPSICTGTQGGNGFLLDVLCRGQIDGNPVSAHEGSGFADQWRKGTPTVHREAAGHFEDGRGRVDVEPDEYAQFVVHKIPQIGVAGRTAGPRVLG